MNDHTGNQQIWWLCWPGMVLLQWIFPKACLRWSSITPNSWLISFGFDMSGLSWVWGHRVYWGTMVDQEAQHRLRMTFTQTTTSHFGEWYVLERVVGKKHSVRPEMWLFGLPTTMGGPMCKNIPKARHSIWYYPDHLVLWLIALRMCMLGSGWFWRYRGYYEPRVVQKGILCPWTTLCKRWTLVVDTKYEWG